MATILTVDDDPIVQKILEANLKSKNFKVIQAKEGKSAIKLLGDNQIDLVICDMNMPKVSGLEVLGFITKNFPLIPVIMLTAQDDINSVVNTMRKGAFDYLPKPFERKALFLSIEKGMIHKNRLEHTLALEKENSEYKKRLEEMVFEKAAELQRKSESYQNLNRELKRAHFETVQVLTEILVGRDEYRADHCNSTHRYCLKFGEKMDLTNEQLEHLSYATLLRDIGEIFIDPQILNKPSRLTADEYRQIRDHPVLSIDLLKKVSYFKPILPIVRGHHEWFNGTGYPDGLKGGQIPLLARIIHVCDAFVAMTNDRAYRSAMPIQQALLIMEKNKGTQFDPKLIDIFNHVIYDTDD